MLYRQTNHLPESKLRILTHIFPTSIALRLLQQFQRFNIHGSSGLLFDKYDDSVVIYVYVKVRNIPFDHLVSSHPQVTNQHIQSLMENWDRIITRHYINAGFEKVKVFEHHNLLIFSPLKLVSSSGSSEQTKRYRVLNLPESSPNVYLSHSKLLNHINSLIFSLISAINSLNYQEFFLSISCVQCQVLSGVWGTRAIQYDVLGSSVNLASRLAHCIDIQTVLVDSPCDPSSHSSQTANNDSPDIEIHSTSDPEPKIMDFQLLFGPKVLPETYHDAQSFPIVPKTGQFKSLGTIQFYQCYPSIKSELDTSTDSSADSSTFRTGRIIPEYSSNIHMLRGALFLVPFTLVFFIPIAFGYDDPNLVLFTVLAYSTCNVLFLVAAVRFELSYRKFAQKIISFPHKSSGYHQSLQNLVPRYFLYAFSVLCSLLVTLSIFAGGASPNNSVFVFS